MAVTIGKKPESDFSDPLGMLSDCHRRIERFLNVLIILTTQSQGSELNEEERHALETALRYFQVAAPMHTLDEEDSLFPRLRAHPDPELHDATHGLETDHKLAEGILQEVEALGWRWLTDGTLPVEAAGRLSLIIHRLQAIYAAHIRQEDHEVFPRAAKLLDPSQVQALGNEMVIRRGFNPARPNLLRQR